jgi:hypothetical protein
MREATPEEAAATLAHALMFRAGKRTHDADRFLANIVAERLVDALKVSGFVLMKRPPNQPNSISLGTGPTQVWTPPKEKA